MEELYHGKRAFAIYQQFHITTTIVKAGTIGKKSLGISWSYQPGCASAIILRKIKRNSFSLSVFLPQSPHYLSSQK